MLVNWKTSLAGVVLIVVGLIGTLLGIHIPGFTMDAGAAITMGIGLLLAKDGGAPNVVKILVAALAVSLFLPRGAMAGDIAGPAPSLSAINKALTSGYPTKCGAYYGIGTGGNAGAVGNGVVGAQIVQGDIDALVGYTCPFAGNAFWFVEGQAGFSNLNGSSNGLSLSGPAVFIERFGVGSPIQQYISAILPNMNLPALPSLPATPGATALASPASYAFVGLVEQDFQAQVGGISGGHDFIVAPILGVGLLTRYSNQMVVDTWAGWQMNATNSVCFAGGCVKPGNMARVGVSLKY